MLSRPHTTVAAADRSQSAATFGLLGLLFGALAVMGLFWLQNLNTSVQQQQSTIEKLEKALEKDAESHVLDLSAERVAAKEAVLDGLLNEVRAGSPPERFVAKYTETEDERNQFKRRYELLVTQTEALAGQATQWKKQLASSEKQVAALEKENSRLSAKGDDDAGGEASVGAPSLSAILAKRYNIAWWTAVAGWVVCGVMAIGMLALLARTVPPEETGMTPRPNP
jgi:hypothetical protein